MASNIVPFPMPEGVEVMTIAQGADDIGIASEIAERMNDADKQQAVNRFLWLLGDVVVGADAGAVRDAATVDATQD